MPFQVLAELEKNFLTTVKLSPENVAKLSFLTALIQVAFVGKPKITWQ